MSFPRYPKYKDSGVEWLGEVPEHWLPFRFKNVFREKDKVLGHSHPPGAISFGNVVLKDGDSMNEATKATYQEVLRGEFLINPINLNYDLKSLRTALSEIDTCVSPAYIVLKLLTHADPQYLKYQLFMFDVRHMKTLGAGVRQTISFADIGPCFTQLPPFEEQTAIAAFLNREPAKIDALVAEQQRLMELLKEKRQAVISQAVTRGLNPAAPLKDSGIEWLGQVPEHWKVKRVKNVSSFITSGPRGWSERVGEEGSLFIQSGDLNNSLGVKFSYSKRVQVEKDAEAARTVLQDGDVVICITGAKTGNVAVCSAVPEPAYINQHLCLIRPNTKVIPLFLGVVLKSKLGQTYFELSQYGLKQGLSLEDVKVAPVLLPPLVEQEAIVSYLNIELAKFNALTTEVKLAIDLLQERRTALISAAVTGQIDVRAMAQVPLTIVKPYSSGFARQLLAAEILHKCHQHPTTGRVKLQKLIHLCEHLAEIDEVGASYARKAAGPFDNKVMFGIASGLAKQKWFAEVKEGQRTVYRPLEKNGEHQKYLARWEDKMPQINRVLELLGKADTQQCEIVSTLYAAWNDLLIEGKTPNDENIIHEASSPERWHENKAKIPLEKWPLALAWMREKGLVPKGFGNHTKRPD